ncbi:MAG TPA: type II toxin-antitoxin system HicB family antitoxin [Fimbriimonadaceae bacterium]
MAKTLTYNVLIERDAENPEAWNVSVPDIDGCYTYAYAYDYENAKAMAKEAIEGMLQSFAAHVQTIPVPKAVGSELVPITVDVPEIQGTVSKRLSCGQEILDGLALARKDDSLHDHVLSQ